MSVFTAEPARAIPAERPAAVVAARDLGRTIDDRPILQQINLEITPGGFLALLGANGAGKSTLLHVLATLLPRTTGTLSLFDKPVNRNATALRRRIGMIGHQPMLYRDLTARENLIFFGAMYGVADRRQRAEGLLERVGLIDRADDPIKTFSRGMVQRTSIARALMHRPQLLLADEPFAGLDVVSNDRLAGLLGELNAEGHTIVVAHHDLAQSLAVARRVVILRSGQVAMDSPVAQVSLKDVRQEVAAG